MIRMRSSGLTLALLAVTMALPTPSAAAPARPPKLADSMAEPVRQAQVFQAFTVEHSPAMESIKDLIAHAPRELTDRTRYRLQSDFANPIMSHAINRLANSRTRSTIPADSLDAAILRRLDDDDLYAFGFGDEKDRTRIHGLIARHVPPEPVTLGTPSDVPLRL